MRVFGVSMVRNEADVIRLAVLHHLSLGMDRILVLENGSSDGTADVLAALARDGGVRWWRNPSPFRPGDLATELAREAHREGADWVVPFDADEFWHVPSGGLRPLLSGSEAVAIQAGVVNFIQRRGQRESSPDALLHMTRRTAAPVGPIEACEDLVESGRIAFVEMLYPPKWISRASASLRYAAGYHAVHGLEGPTSTDSGLLILHAPIRSKAALEAKAEQGRRVEEAGFENRASWHVRRFRRLREEGGLEEEWAANSYEEDRLSLRGESHVVVFDPRLRDTVAPWI